MGSLRIIAGAFKGRRIHIAAGSTTRPTAERAREALFSILGASVRGARVLDAFSGSGALGFEALSRDAAQVVFVESDPRAVRGLRETAESFGVGDRCVVIAGRVSDHLRGGGVQGPFDLILADPPYAAGEVERFLDLVSDGRLLAPAGRLVIEHEWEEVPTRPAPPGLRPAGSRRYGRCTFDFYDSEA